MTFYTWIFVLFFQFVSTERAGITHCSTEEYGSSATGGSAGSHTSYLMQDPGYQFQCCGVVENIVYSAAGSVTLKLQVWRQTDATNFELISEQDYTLSSSPFTPDDDKRVSFREGDLFGWGSNNTFETILTEQRTGQTMIRLHGCAGTSSAGNINKGTGSQILNWVKSSALTTAVGASHTWYSESIDGASEYQIKIVTQASTEPYFRNLPATLIYADTDLLVGGATLMTLSYNDIDPNDASDLTVSLSPAWNDLFELTTGTTPDLIKTKEALGPGTYMPVFRIEEGHCGKTASATLTVSVTDSVPSIDNLPGFATVHEDDLDETLLYTVTMSDPTNQAMWCRGDWTIGTEANGDTPFIVKMISTTGGSSQAGIYLIEDPKLDYDATSTYSLTIVCMDTYGNTATGTFWVNVIKNQLPIFSNLANMVEVDATTVVAGTTAFTISTTDYDSDQITFAYTCTGACPFDVFHSGEVKATGNLLTHTAASSYELSVTATDVRGTTAAKTLKIYIINTNNDPTFTNVNGQSVSVAENADLGKSLYQMSATDSDSSDTLTYYMTINNQEGYDIFELSSSGELTTHSTYNINYDILSTTSFTLTIYVNDGKKQVSETFTATVTNVNEAPYFLASEYIVTQLEADAGAFTDNPGIGTAVDPDSGDTLAYTRDCGTTYDSYISIDSSTGALSFAQTYDLDDAMLGLTTFIQCTVYVTDAGGLNDSASLYINIEYDNDNAPVLDPPSGPVTVSSGTPMGYPIATVRATDADLGDVGSTLTYSLNQAAIGTGNHFIIDDGVIYATDVLTSLANAGTKTLTVTVTDDGGLTDTENVVLQFIDSTVVISPTTDRNWEFIEDQRNITWLTISVITIATCLSLIACAIIRSCMKRETPLIDFKKLWPKMQPKRKLDKKRRPLPLGKQAAPQYRHVHANEVLRASPILVASPAPVDANSLRPGSASSGRVTVTEVRVNDTNWMDGHETPAPSAAPVKSVTRPRTEEWEYINPNRSHSLSPDQIYGTERSSVSQASALSTQRRTTAQRSTPWHVSVTPSPVPFDNASNDTDDFKSERISIASPVSQHDAQEPIY